MKYYLMPKLMVVDDKGLAARCHVVWSTRVGTFTLGYWVREDRRREGLATKLLSDMTEHVAPMARQLVISRENEASEGVAKKCGYAPVRLLPHGFRLWRHKDYADTEEFDDGPKDGTDQAA